METEAIKEKIEQTKIKLIPLFAITDEERSKLQTPLITRELDENDYPGVLFRAYSGYDGLRNMFYFPEEHMFESERIKVYGEPSSNIGYADIFREKEFVHFTASYLHHQINSDMRKAALTIQTEKKEPEGYYELRQLVAEYPNIILGNRSLDNPRDRSSCRTEFHLFIDHGPDFLPKLSKMSIDDVLNKGLIKPEEVA